MSRTIFPKCSLFLVYIFMSFISMSKASSTKLRVRNKRDLQSQCEKSCNSEEIVRVLVETANETGKITALECSISGSANTNIKIGDGYILGFSVCSDDRAALAESEGVLYVEDDQVMTILDSDCKKDCNSDEIDRVLVTTRDEEGKENALMCSMTSMTDKGGDTEKRRDEGYILGIGICPDDKTALENSDGVFSVEDDQVMTILDSGCKKDCNSDEIDRVLVTARDEEGKENALMCSMTSMTDKGGDTEKRRDEGYILGIGICPDDKTALENSDGVLYVEDDQVMTILDSDCKKDCNSDEIDRVLVTTRDEEGKENALMCSMTSMTDKGGDTEKRRDEGYILGIGICPDDKTALENSDGVFSVEDDQVMSVLDSDCKKDCSSDEIEKVLVQTADEIGKENTLLCSTSTMTDKDDMVIEMTEGYILGIGICPDDRIALQNSEGVMLVEDDAVVRIADKEP